MTSTHDGQSPGGDSTSAAIPRLSIFHQQNGEPCQQFLNNRASQDLTTFVRRGLGVNAFSVGAMPRAPLPSTAKPPPGGFRRGSVGYRRASAAAFLAGAGSLSVLYAPQAVLPLLAADFAISPAASSLAISVSTGAIAVSLLPMSSLSARWGYARVMTVSLAVTTVLAVLVPLSPTFATLLALRAIQGVAFAGVPALVIAYLGSTIHGSWLGSAVGLFVAGNTVGGLSGRLLAAAVADVVGWRAAFAAVALFAGACLVGFWWLLPTRGDGARGERSEFGDSTTTDKTVGQHVAAHLRDSGLLALFAISFVLMSAFVSVYNYLPYRLLDAPFALSPAVVGLIFLAYLAGGFAAGVAGRLGDRLGQGRVLRVTVLISLLAILLTWPDQLAFVLGGLVLITAGFFGAHSSASADVRRRAVRGGAEASALYLSAYYAGNGIGGYLSGFAFEAWGWPGIVAFVTCALLLALGLVHVVRRPRRRVEHGRPHRA